jgi:hypothetical protein
LNFNRPGFRLNPGRAKQPQVQARHLSLLSLPLFYCDSANLSINLGWHVFWHAFGDDPGTVAGYTVIKTSRDLWRRSEIMMANKLNQLSEKMMAKSSLWQIMPAWLRKYSQRRTFQAALRHAYITWTASNWEWVDYSCNEHFLTYQAAPYLIQALEETTQPDPAQLANVWAEQFTWFDEAMRQRHVAALIPAIISFLSCLEQESSSRVKMITYDCPWPVNPTPCL